MRLRLHRRYARLVFTLFMAANMSLVMTLVITLFNLGAAWTLHHWLLRAWPLAFGVAFPLILILTPAGEKLAARLTRN